MSASTTAPQRIGGAPSSTTHAPPSARYSAALSSSSDTTPPSLGEVSASSSHSPSSASVGSGEHSATSEVSSVSLNTDSPVVFVALHAGAGYHNPAHHIDLQELFHSACQLALTRAGSAEEAVYLAIQMLESSPLTNAGRGSVLTEDGRVECEASMMLGNGAYSGVGAVSGVEHPIQLAYQLVKERNEYGLIKELGRVRPILLVGEGAWKYAEEKGFARVEQQEWYHHHVTDETRRKWKRFRKIIDKHKQKQARAREELRVEEKHKVAAQQQHLQHAASTEHSPKSESGRKRPRSPSAPRSSPPSAAAAVPVRESVASTSTSEDEPDEDDSGVPFHGKQHGTVGAIACDERGRVCAGVSSGGIWMKTPGRIGSAALLGCGCHAENGDDEDRAPREDDAGSDSISVACSISGCGEDIIEELMAVRCCDALRAAKLSDTTPAPVASTMEHNTPAVSVAQASNGAHARHNDSSMSEKGGSADKQAEWERLMRQLIEKESKGQDSFLLNDKKRTRNAQGSNDTQQQDDGLSSGIIACRVVKRRKQRREGSQSANDAASPGEERMEEDGDGTSEELTLDFCHAHTAPHFAVAYAVNDRLNGYQNKGWISQKSESEREKRSTKLGHVSIKIAPQNTRRKQQQRAEHDDASEGKSEEQRAQPSEQRRVEKREDVKDGHVVGSVQAEQRTARTAVVRQREDRPDENEQTSENGPSGRESRAGVK